MNVLYVRVGWNRGDSSDGLGESYSVHVRLVCRTWSQVVYVVFQKGQDDENSWPSVRCDAVML